MNVLLLGSTGQVGSAILRLAPKDWKILAWSRADVDFADTAGVRKRLNELARSGIAPEIIVNAAAYTKVDLAESNPVEATKLNVDLPQSLAEAARVWKAKLIHYSTDYVYPGDGESAQRESDDPCPLGVYGKTKLLGDQAIERAGCDYLIFRTSWVYAATGKNFLLTMLNLAKDRPELRVVSDQIGSPTLADDIARATIDAAAKAKTMPTFPSGIYHLANSGFTSWHGFASAIVDEARRVGMKVATQTVTPILTREYPTPARRPHNSRLSLQKLEDTFGLRPRPWQEAMKEVIRQLSKGESKA